MGIGRRHEAVQLIRELAASGDVLLDELHALMAESDAIYDRPGTPPAENTRPYWPIGPMGQARWEFTQGRYREAADRVQSLVEKGDSSASTIAFYGLAVAEAQDEKQFDWWLSKVNDQVKDFPEYWAAIGTHLMTEGRFEEALRALAEAIDGNPTDVRSTRRVIQGFRSLGNQAMTDRWVKKYDQLTDTIRLSVQIADGRMDLTQELVTHLQQLNRPLEAIMWTGVAASRMPNAAELMQQLNAQRVSVLNKDIAFPSRADKWGQWDFDQTPLPQLEPPSSVDAIAESEGRTSNAKPMDRPSLRAKFRNEQKIAGIVHRERRRCQPALVL